MDQQDLTIPIVKPRSSSSSSSSSSSTTTTTTISSSTSPRFFTYILSMALIATWLLLLGIVSTPSRPKRTVNTRGILGTSSFRATTLLQLPHSSRPPSPPPPPPPTFDIVYCINLPEDKTFRRINYDQIEALFVETVRHVALEHQHQHHQRQLSPPARIHLLSNDDEAISRLRSRFPKLRVYDYRTQPLSERAQLFMKSYVHQSTNHPEMERLCMLRWIIMADYFRGLAAAAATTGSESDTHTYTQPYRYILGLDTDVVLLAPPQRLVSEERLRRWAGKGKEEEDKKDEVEEEDKKTSMGVSENAEEVERKTNVDGTTVEIEAHQIAQGAAMLWSLAGLESFASFLVDAYATPMLAAEKVKAWGFMFSECRPKNSILIPCDEGKEEREKEKETERETAVVSGGEIEKKQDESNEGMWHISDMDILRAWFLKARDRRTRVEEETDCLVVRQAKKASGLAMRKEGGTDDATAVPVRVWGKWPSSEAIGGLGAGNGTAVVKEEEGEEEKEVCLLHFQGPKSKELIGPFADFLAEKVEERGTGSAGGQNFVLP